MADEEQEIEAHAGAGRGEHGQQRHHRGLWGLAFEAGYFHRRLVNAPRGLDLSLMSAGLFALVGLVSSRLCPGSMVGVPGDRMSNIGPPTFVIIALLVFQLGLAEVVRPRMERARHETARPRPG